MFVYVKKHSIKLWSFSLYCILKCLLQTKNEKENISILTFSLAHKCLTSALYTQIFNVVDS